MPRSFTEVGYVGRDVESIVRDLVDLSFNMVKEEFGDAVAGQAEERVEEKLLDLLGGSLPQDGTPSKGLEQRRERLRKGFALKKVGRAPGGAGGSARASSMIEVLSGGSLRK